jgi:hypothetical protein
MPESVCVGTFHGELKPRILVVCAYLFHWLMCAMYETKVDHYSVIKNIVSY